MSLVSTYENGADEKCPLRIYWSLTSTGSISVRVLNAI